MGFTPLVNAGYSRHSLGSDDFQELQSLRPAAGGIFIVAGSASIEQNLSSQLSFMSLIYIQRQIFLSVNRSCLADERYTKHCNEIHLYS